MFKNYYYLLGIPSNSNEQDIIAAIDELQGKRSSELLEEIRMVLQNKRLKELYDLELEKYKNSKNKDDYVISNCDLVRELNKIKAYQESRAASAVDELIAKEEKRNSFKRSLKWFIIGTIILSLIKCTASILYQSPYYY